MKDATPQTVYLRDYKPFDYVVDGVKLTFQLDARATRVISRIAFRPNPATTTRAFFLHGENLKLISASIDGLPVTPDVTATGLTCPVPDAPFVFEAEVEISPQDNAALDGLYISNGMYCTQCEAEGFRKITYYPDRPDVMARFDVRIESDLPVLLSNGNPTGAGPGWAEWHDPWPKPAYLFALVAGDLASHTDRFTTMEGRDVTLNIWTRPGPDQHKCAFAMEALKKAMAWDETTYGRAYDLDLFNIVAVDDFNMGAMENKGLNIFNASAVLASPETATDSNFERIEAIIAHEYFHNWTGNRITCRDWFQLCLKEGLTVYRDQQFTADMRGAAVKRINDTIVLRAHQFREDAGPLAHPVRPDRFVEINNFYTATVYEKGAEIIGMLRRLVGDDAYYRATDLYFSRHDGDAATIEDWLAVFTETTGRDLTQFARWYSQAGTPRVTVTDDFTDGTYTLTLKQTTPPTPGQPDKDPLLIPVAVGLLDDSGAEILPTTLLELTEAEQSFAFPDLPAKPVPSLLRGFSAPVIITHSQTDARRAFLLAHDTDPFNRWDAARTLAQDVLARMVRYGAAPDSGYLDGLAAVLRDDTLDPAFRTLVLALPSEDDTANALAAAGHPPDPSAIYDAHETLKTTIAQHLQDLLPRAYADMTVTEHFAPTAAQSARRALQNAVLALISRLDGGRQAAKQYASADNMTGQIAALAALLKTGKGADELAAFADKWRDDRLVMDKWFALQISCSPPDRVTDTVTRLTAHPAFTLTNPNRFRAVFGALAGNAAGFHDPSGKNYTLLADWLIKLDRANPQTTARMITAYSSWRRYDADRQTKMHAALTRIADTPGLSPDTTEMVTRLLR